MSEISIFYFSIEDLCKREYLDDYSNVELYSLDESFCDNILWKFQVCLDEESLDGSVQKLKNGQPVGFLQQEGKTAIYQNFMGSYKHSITELEPFEFEDFYKGSNIAFTLRVNKFDDDEKMRLQSFAEKSFSSKDEQLGSYSIKTGLLKVKPKVYAVFGLLKMSQPIDLLENYVSILKSHFDPDLIRWMNVCTDDKIFKNICF